MCRSRTSIQRDLVEDNSFAFVDLNNIASGSENEQIMRKTCEIEPLGTVNHLNILDDYIGCLKDGQGDRT